MQKAQIRARNSALHKHYVAPLSFLLDAADQSFKIPKQTREPF